MPSKGLTGAVSFLAVAMLAACSSSSGQIVEPRPDLKHPAGCNVPFGVARLGQLFYALNQQDVGAVQALFPAGGEWALEIAPSIPRSLSAGHPLPDADADRATSQAAISSVVYSLAGLHLVFAAVPDGHAGPVQHVSPSGSVTVNEVDLGPVAWAAVGPALEVRGKSRISGGGKIALSCDSGLFIKVTLGLQAIE
jgi:hypothetical protein